MIQLQITGTNYHGGSVNYNTTTSVEELVKYRDIIEKIYKNINNTHWNWFSTIPTKWDGENFVIDKWKLLNDFLGKFGEKVNVIDIIEFYTKFTPHGCDKISSIKIANVEYMDFDTMLYKYKYDLK